MAKKITVFRCESHTRQRVRQAAQRREATMSDVIRTALREHLDNDDTDDDTDHE